MSIEGNKKLVTEFFGKISTNDLAGAFAMIHDDVVWWSAGGDLFPYSGTKTKSEWVATTSEIASIFPKGLALLPKGMVAEGERVAVEVVGHGVTPAGRNYDNLYHFLITLKDGKIIAAKEYMDTLYAKVTLLDP